MQDIQNDILKLQELYNHAKQVTQDRDLKLQTKLYKFIYFNSRKTFKKK